MTTLQPIYTEKAKCQDCYRCVRSCPVKAIKIEQGVASIVDELCIFCGTCVNSCPAGAKRVRNDRTLVKVLLDSGARVIASLAPSYASEFRGVAPGALVAALQRLGFFGVSETALGAQEVSAHAARLLMEGRAQTWISSACPTVVEYIRKYRPELVPAITPLLSPLLTHGRMLKTHFGADTHVVFFGPCIAKKVEAARHPELVDAALTFKDLRALFDDAGMVLDTRFPADGRFIPTPAQEGALYPIDGGMVTSVKAACSVCDHQAMHFSGMAEICSVLEHAAQTDGSRLFLELLACAGGCVNGPRTQTGLGTLTKRIAVLENRLPGDTDLPRAPTIDINELIANFVSARTVFSEEAITGVLRRTGKRTVEDELNCGGCGYGNCREFARAVLEGKAEKAMCVTHMRELANKKANKLIMAMPSAVVIVDKDLKIIECNGRFASMAGEDSLDIYSVHPGMAGAALDKVFPVGHLFRHVLETGEEILNKDLHVNDQIVHCSVFSIEAESIAGGIFNDVTAPELKKEEIIKRAQTVIHNNLTTVQKIAYLMGENASETEMVLSSIIDSFKETGAEGTGDAE
jgi:iron only hydrogenase large subunit-like protein